MPIPLVNSIASWFLKKRIHQMELFIKYPHEVQQELLKNLIAKARHTEIGKKYDFCSNKGLSNICRQGSYPGLRGL
jgi:hypothetical protein